MSARCDGSFAPAFIAVACAGDRRAQVSEVFLFVGLAERLAAL